MAQKPPVSTPAVAQVLVAARKLKSKTPVNWSLRNSGIVTRVAEAPGLRIRQSAFQVRAAVTQTLGRLGINMDGLEFPGFLEARTVGGQTTQVSVSKAIFPSNRALIDEVVQGRHDFVTADADNAALFSDAIRSLETTTAVLRIVEARIDEVKEAIEVCRAARGVIAADVQAARARLAEVELRIAEARHDVTTTLALLAEEAERVDAVNDERERILAEEVPFVAWCRPRVVDSSDTLPVHDIEPALAADPVRVGLSAEAPPAPEELHEMVELVRHLPARSVLAARTHTGKVATLALLGQLLGESVERAGAAVKAADARSAPTAHGPIGRTQGLVHARRQAVLQHRRGVASATSVRAGASWQETRAVAEKALTLDDLVSSPTTSADTSRAIAGLIADLHKAAAFLYAEVSGIDARIRMEWALLLSEHDEPRDLRDPSALPGWQNVDSSGPGADRDPFRRRELEAWIEWIFGRFDLTDREATDFASDLVRVAILLASHAPVDDILHAHVEEPTVLQPGIILPIRVDITRIKVGMPALILVDDKVLGRGVIEDVSDGRARARIASVASAGSTLAAGQAVRLVDARQGAAAPTPLTRKG